MQKFEEFGDTSEFGVMWIRVRLRKRTHRLNGHPANPSKAAMQSERQWGKDTRPEVLIWHQTTIKTVLGVTILECFERAR
jgi:hypothetical protein